MPATDEQIRHLIDHQRERYVPLEPAKQSIEMDGSHSNGVPRLSSGRPVRCVMCWEVDSLPEPQYLIDEFAGEDHIHINFGDPKSAKTLSRIHKAFCIGRGVPYFGRNVIQGGAAIISAEAQSSTLQRLQAYRRHQGIERDHLPVWVYPDRIDFYSSNVDARAIADDIKRAEDQLKVECRYTCIDSLMSSLPGGSDSNSKDVNLFVGNVQELQASLTHPIHIDVIHHAGRSNEERTRGSNHIDAMADATWRATLDENGDGWLINTINRHGASGTKLAFTVASVDLGTNSRGQTINSAICLERIASESDFAATKQEKLIGKGRAAHEALCAVCLDRDTISVDFDVFEDALLRREIVDPTKPENNQRARFSELRKALKNHGKADFDAKERRIWLIKKQHDFPDAGDPF